MGYAEVSADTLAGSALVEQPSVMTLTLQDVKSGQLEISVKRYHTLPRSQSPSPTQPMTHPYT
jgi:hypothetical protein